jgi:hypothetical protein
MANGQQLAEINYQRFLRWIDEKSDHDFRQMESRGVLSRTDIAKECGISKSSLDSNPRIKAELKRLENGLRERGVLPQLAPKEADGSEMPLRPRDAANRLDAARLKRLEQENASLRAENKVLKEQLRSFSTLQQVLQTTGRVPR